jgi:2Fe-2S ferredoxin
MTDAPRNIQFVIHYLNKDHKVLINKKTYNDLRDLIINQIGAENFGHCGGTGRCATCMVKICDPNMGPEHLKRKVSAVLQDEIVATDSNIFFACQTTINDDLSNMNIYVL